jgi:hypothetical protein
MFLFSESTTPPYLITQYAGETNSCQYDIFCIFVKLGAKKNLPGKGGEETREAIDNTVDVRRAVKLF